MFALALLAAGAGALASKNLEVDPTNDPFFIKNDSTWTAFERFSAQYGSAQSIAVGIELPQGFTPEAAGRLNALGTELEKIPGVGGMMSLSKVREYRMGWPGRIEEAQLLDAVSKGKETSADFLKRRPSWPPQARHLVSEDGRMAGLVLFLPADPQASIRVLEEARRVVARHQSAGSRVLMTGSAVEQQSFSEKIERDRRIFVPLCIVTIVVLLVAFYRSFASLFYALAVMGGSLAVTQGAMAVLQAKLHAITSLLAPVILIVAVSSTVKASGIFFITPPGRSPEGRLDRAMRLLFAPCLLANVTTVIGFLSLLVSRIPAVRDFGFYGALGTTAAFVFTLLLAPALGTYMREGERTRPSENLGGVLARWTGGSSAGILAAALAFSAFSLWKAPEIRVSTDFLKVFRADDPFRLDTESFQKKLGGVYSVELELRPSAARALESARSWDAIDRFENRIEDLPGVSYAFGAPDVVRYFEKTVVRMARSDWLLKKIIDGIVSSGESSKLWAGRSSPEAVRLTLFIESADTGLVTRTARDIPRIAREILGPDWTVLVTGETRLLSEMSETLVRDELVSVAAAFGIILILLLLVVRSLPYALLCVVPNFLPIAGLFGSMALLGIALNTSTAMIASVTIGLIFDNTVYLIYGYREARTTGMNARAAVACSLSDRVKPMLASSALLWAGFGVTVFGQMIPTSQFGLLSCLTIGFATLSDLLVVPSVLHLLKPR